jgi:hypothetical protein
MRGTIVARADGAAAGTRTYLGEFLGRKEMVLPVRGRGFEPQFTGTYKRLVLEDLIDRCGRCQANH